MNRETILQFLRDHKLFFQQSMGVKSIGLFGSYAKNKASGESDIDILVELESPDFQRLMSLQIFLEEHLSKSVDLLRKGPHLRPQFLKSIEAEIVYA